MKHNKLTHSTTQHMRHIYQNSLLGILHNANVGNRQYSILFLVLPHNWLHHWLRPIPKPVVSPLRINQCLIIVA